MEAVFRATDGKEFSTKEECMQHEADKAKFETFRLALTEAGFGKGAISQLIRGANLLEQFAVTGSVPSVVPKAKK